MTGFDRVIEFVSQNLAEVVLAAAVVLGAVGMWLLLPRGNRRGRALGAVLAVAALGLLAYRLPSLAAAFGWLEQGVFWILAATTVVAAVGAVTFRSPAYCAIWFALSLLGTAALMLFQGAQFLALATVAVYAGAILVTFLFVLMLARPTGQAASDRISWEPLLAAATGAILVGVLTYTILDPASEDSLQPAAAPPSEKNVVLAENHMAGFGGQLFSRHLIAVEVAGTLLLVALVGAVAISTANRSKVPAEDGPSNG